MAVKDAVKNPRLGEVVNGDDLAKLPENIQTGIAEGHLLPVWSEVEVSDDASPTGKGVIQEYIRLYSLDAQGMSILNNGKIKPATPAPAEGEDKRTEEEKAKGACDYHDYGHDLEVKRKIRMGIMAGLEGPDKAVKKAVSGLKAMEHSDEEIVTMIKASPKFKGVEGLDKLIATALKA